MDTASKQHIAVIIIGLLENLANHFLWLPQIAMATGSHALVSIVCILPWHYHDHIAHTYTICTASFLYTKKVSLLHNTFLLLCLDAVS